MKTTARGFPAAPFALAAALLTGFLLLLAPLSASAHDVLLSSSPEADATVDTLPGELVLTFSAQLIDEVGATEVVVTDANGVSVIEGSPTVNGAIVTQPLKAEAQAGSYDVIWKMVSSDGHPTSGVFSFTVANSTEATPTEEPSEPSETAAPSQTPEATVTQAPVEDSTGDDTGIWALAIVGGLVIIVVIVIVVVSRRRRTTPTDSADSSGL